MDYTVIREVKRGGKYWAGATDRCVAEMIKGARKGQRCGKPARMTRTGFSTGSDHGDVYVRRLPVCGPHYQSTLPHVRFQSASEWRQQIAWAPLGLDTIGSNDARWLITRLDGDDTARFQMRDTFEQTTVAYMSISGCKRWAEHVELRERHPELTAVRIDVTADDIAKGERGGFCNCPVALAMLRAGFREVVVCDATLEAVPPGEASVVEWPPGAVAAWLAAYDGEAGPVAPFTFDVNLNDCWVVDHPEE